MTTLFRRPVRRSLVLAIPVLLLCTGAFAQTTSPTRPVTIVVPFAPGGGTDIGTRIVAQRLSQIWGQPVLIDNKGGAGGNVGLEIVSRAKADGYTLMTGNVGTQSINPTLYKKLNYNPDKAGVKGAEFGSWLGLLAPAGTPQDIVDKISKGVQQVVAQAEVQQQLLAQGAVAISSSAADFTQLIANDRKRYARIIIDNKLGID
jgi:tripartite-type tricarboxylate transporter receptor subunit TctC